LHGKANRARAGLRVGMAHHFATLAVVIRRGFTTSSRSEPGLRARVFDRILRLLPGPSPDGNPIFWREWHRRRPSRWARVVWWGYGVMTVGLTATLVASSASGTPARREVASIGNGFQAGIGLLLLSVSAATVLAEERVSGNLEILLATPLETRSIVWGKWWGTFRGVPWLAICPGIVATMLARESGRWSGVVLIVGLYVAYAAALTSLGLALSIWVRRIDLAATLSAGILGGVTVGWFLAAVALFRRWAGPELAVGSPIIGITFPTVATRYYSNEEWYRLVVCWILWISIYGMIALGLGLAALRSFNRCLGRLPER
jgi:ABC-type transport system involved in multi-copper enzyme maturation permease subunit